MRRPVLLDLFCGAGGAAKGYHQAGFDVVGVDIEPQPSYPYRFFEGDVRVVAADVLGDFDIKAIHASPPCQSQSALTKGTNKGNAYPDLIPWTRNFVAEQQLPAVIENVQGSYLRRDVVLCGEMFGLGVIRHRYFELHGWTVAAPPHLRHRGRVRGYRHGTYYEGPYFAVYGHGGGWKGSLQEWREAMGTPWMATKKEIAEAIPPAYTEYLGTALRRHLAKP